MVKVWDARNGRLLADCRGHQFIVSSVAFADGNRVVSGGADWTVKVWDAWSGELLADCRGHTGWVKSVAFSPDGRLVVSCGWDASVKLWDAFSGRCLNTLFYEFPIAQIALIRSIPSRLLVADNTGRAFAYQLVEPS
jgi:WD40 repeat protein